MAIDIEVIKIKSGPQIKKELEKLQLKLYELESDLEVVERKIKMGLLDENSNAREITPLLSYREELKQMISRIKKDILLITNLIEGVKPINDEQSVASNIAGTGTVIFRGLKNIRKVEGALTYDEINALIEDKRKEKELEHKVKLAEEIRNIIEYSKMEESKKITPKQPHTSKL